MPGPEPARAALPFHLVNRRGSAHHDPALQRHHLLPRQILAVRAFSPLLRCLGEDRIGLHDFRRNGLLLPAREDAVQRIGLPLHRGPHRDYNAMVLDRVGRIELQWSRRRARDEQGACEDALRQLDRLQGALRRRLLATRVPLRLNRSDPLGSGLDYRDIDAMAELLWREA